MDIFVAGGSGTLGLPLVRDLSSAGHRVTALTRTDHKQQMLRAAGAEPVVADIFDAPALGRMVAAAKPDVVVHLLTALPPRGPTHARQLGPTNRLRDEGTRQLIAASVAAGARRLVAESFALVYGFGDHGDTPQSEDMPYTAPHPNAAVQSVVEALRSLERQVSEANSRRQLEGISLRYGLFYGADNPATREMFNRVSRRALPAVRGDRSLLPCIQMDDAVRATRAAIEAAEARGAYNVCDDRPVSFSDIVTGIAEASGAPLPRQIPRWLFRLFAPFMAEVIASRLPLSNRRAHDELGWTPHFRTCAEGLADCARVLSDGR